MDNNTTNNIILLNGTLCDQALWYHCITELQTLVDAIQCTFPDITNGDSVNTLADTIGKTYLSPHTNNWLLGYSLGGIIALECAKRYHNTITGMILVCTNPDGQTPEKTHAVERQLQCLNTKGLASVFDEMLIPAYFGTMVSTYTDQATQVKNAGIAIGETVLRNQLKTLITRIDQKPYLADIHIPTLLVCGELDTLCTLEQNRMMCTLLPQSTLHVCQETGHMLPLLQASELAKQIAWFINNR